MSYKSKSHAYKHAFFVVAFFDFLFENSTDFDAIWIWMQRFSVIQSAWYIVTYTYIYAFACISLYLSPFLLFYFTLFYLIIQQNTQQPHSDKNKENGKKKRVKRTDSKKKWRKTKIYTTSNIYMCIVYTWYIVYIVFFCVCSNRCFFLFI